MRVAGIEWEDVNAHSALYDTQKTAELFCKIFNAQKPRSKNALCPTKIARVHSWAFTSALTVWKILFNACFSLTAIV
jgi:hypothetical protein